MSFTQAQNTFGLLQKDFFAYLQIRFYININVISTQDTIWLGPIEKLIIKLTLKKGFISYFLNGLQSYDWHNINKLIKQWEEDFRSVYNEEDWEGRIRSTHFVFFSNSRKKSPVHLFSCIFQ